MGADTDSCEVWVWRIEAAPRPESICGSVLWPQQSGQERRDMGPGVSSLLRAPSWEVRRLVGGPSGCKLMGPDTLGGRRRG